MLAVEEVSRVLRIRGHWPKPGERLERRSRPLPAVADQIVDPPGAAARRVRARRLWVPAREIEHAMRWRRLGLSPGVRTLRAVERAECGSLELGFAGQARAGPARKCRCLRVAHVHRPGGRKWDPVEHAAPPPATIPLLPEERMCQLSALDPLPVLGVPPARIAIAAGFDKRPIAFVGDVLRLERKRGHLDDMGGMLVVPPKPDGS